MRQRAARFVLAGTFAAKGILVTAGMNTAARKATQAAAAAPPSARPMAARAASLEANQAKMKADGF